MATRTFRLIGTTTDANITVNFNGSQVFNGVAGTGTEATLCEFTAEDSVTGSIATTVTVNSGSVTIIGIMANLTVPQNSTSDPVVTEADTLSRFNYFTAPGGNGGTYASAESVVSASINDEAVDLSNGPGGLIPLPLDNGDVLSASFNITAPPGLID